MLSKGNERESSGASRAHFVTRGHGAKKPSAPMLTLCDLGGAAAKLLDALRSALGQSDMMAYLAMMAIRLLELHRVLKPTGTLYLHCDPTASHYLKVMLDAIFGPSGYRNEIIWKRSNPKSLASVNFPTCTDTILRYAKGSKVVFHPTFEAHDPEYVEKAYKYKDEKGVFRLLPLLNPNDNRPNLTYEFLGVTRVWRWTKERMQAAYECGLVIQLKSGAVPQYKKYLEDSKGRTVTNCWTDVPQAGGNESLGYPTQKPIALLERIISASSEVILYSILFVAAGQRSRLRKNLGVNGPVLISPYMQSR